MQRLSFFDPDTIPDEMFGHIFSFENLSTLVKIKHVCKTFNRIVSQNQLLWKNLFKKHFYLDIPGTNLMEKFMVHYVCEQVLAHKTPALHIALNILEDEWEKKEPILKKAFEVLSAFKGSDLCASTDLIWVNYLLGNFYQIGYGSPEKGLELLNSVAAQGNALAMYSLYQLLFPQNSKQAIKWLKLSHTHGCQIATYELADHYQHGWHVKEDMLKYFELLFQLAKNDHAGAALSLVYLYLNSPYCRAYIPFGDIEWEWSYKKPSDILEHEEFSSRGSLKASWYAMNYYSRVENKEKLTFFRARYEKLLEDSIPLRQERAIYWLEKTIEYNTTRKGHCLFMLNKLKQEAESSAASPDCKL